MKKSNSRLILPIILIMGIVLAGCISAGTDNDKGELKYLTYYDTDVDDTLKIYYGTSENAPMMNKLCEDFERETGIRTTWEAADNADSQLKKMYAVNEAPDVYSIARQDLPSWSERVLCLDDEPWVDDLLLSAKESAMVDGHLIAWPHTIEASGIVYNKDLFRKASITEVPKTLDELEVVCRRLEMAGIQPFGESWMQFGYLAHLMATPFVYEGAMDVSESIRNGDRSFADLEYIDEYFDVLDMTLDYGLGSESADYNAFYQYADFAAGKMAMMKQGTWSERTIEALAPDIDTGLFALPLSNDESLNRLMTSSTSFVCINKDSPMKAEALEFVRWWHNNAEYYLIEINKTMPPFKSVDGSKLGSLNQSMFDYIESNNYYDIFGYEYWPEGFHEDSAAIVQDYIRGKTDRDETMNRLTELYRAEGK